MSHIDNVNFLPRAKASVNYAMAREAIKLDAESIAKSNQARAKNWANATKSFVVDHLQGIIVQGKKGTYVDFADGSKAKF